MLSILILLSQGHPEVVHDLSDAFEQGEPLYYSWSPARIHALLNVAYLIDLPSLPSAGFATK